ncbi:MAG: hypothetical protein HUJ68_08215 [Clostridia bacterium]|nr:hypothetical protein [Clostridia bacterium]
MVIYSNEIKNFLDKIYFYELSHRNDLDFPLYHFYEEKLYSIDKLTSHKPSTTFPMSRDGLFGMIIGRLEFGYSYDGTNVYVQYYINSKPQNDWFDWLIKETKIKSINNNTMNNTKNRIRLTETQLHNLIKESVRNVLEESDYHRAFKQGKNLDVLHTTDGTYTDSDIWDCLAKLKEKLHQAEERAKLENFGNEGKTRNYLVGAIRGIQAFIDSRY